MAGAFTISEQLDKVLNEFVEDERSTINDSFAAAGKKAKQEVAQRSPGSGSYKKGWRVKNDKSKHVIEVTVYNATDGQLTHLLENSHMIRNGDGTYGRTSPGHGQVVHIAPAREAAEAYLLDQLKSKL